MSLEQLLHDWLPKQRWFAGKDHPLVAVRIVTRRDLLTGDLTDDPSMLHVLVEVDQTVGLTDLRTVTYQLLLGVRDQLPERLEHASIGHIEELGAVYDATHDQELMHEILGWIA